MLHDSFRISSKFHPDKRCANTNAESFFTDFHEFYYNVRMKKNPSLPKSICDPYGFMLLCEDFKDVEVNLDKALKCKAVYKGEGKKNNISYQYYKGMFTVPQLLNLLYRGYWFDYNLAINIYNIQHDALSIFSQIMNGRGYIMNRFKPGYKKVGKLMNYASESKISLDEDKFIPIPYVNRVCDGMSWPCIINKNVGGYYCIREDDVGGYGVGLCMLDYEDNIVDVLKINDTWLTELPLATRLNFAHKFKNFEPIPYLKAWSLRSAYDCAKQLGADRHNGVLVRPCHEDFFTNRWFNWNELSLIYCCNINNSLTTYNVKRSKPKFYTLEGEEGKVNPIEERANEKMWLDDFDIKEFQQILELE